MAQVISEDGPRWKRRALTALVLLAAVVLPGVTNYVLVEMGYNLLGSAVWAIGYGAGVIVLWYVWIRPLDLTGPSR